VYPDTAAAIAHYDGHAWTPQSTFSTARLYGIWGTSATHVFAVGEASTILHSDGTSWTEMTNPGGDFYAVWGRGASDVYAVGSIILHWDGASWAPLRIDVLGDPSDLLAISGRSDGHAIAVGTNGKLMQLPPGRSPTRYGGACAHPLPLYCASPDPWFGDTTGSPATRASWTCGGARMDTGPEVYYRLDSPITGRLTATLTPHAGDLDLIALGGEADMTRRGCDPDACLAASQHDGSGAIEQVTIPIVQGQTYYLAIDGYSGAASGYTLDVQCEVE
jgi:hypothetical protein